MFGAMYKWRLRFQKSGLLRKLAGFPKERPDETAGLCVPAREVSGAVKGVARRVVIVSEPDPDVFEEAIFVVREDFINGGGVGASDILREAKTAAGGYIESALGRPSRRAYPILRAAVCVAIGVALTVSVWFLLRWFALL